MFSCNENIDVNDDVAFYLLPLKFLVKVLFRVSVQKFLYLY